MAPKQFTINRRRLTIALAIASPIGIGIGLMLRGAALAKAWGNG